METWEHLQARLFHLGWLGEELPVFVACPSGAWLFRQIIQECQTVAAIAAEYVAECERAGLTGPDGTTPPPGTCRCGGVHHRTDGRAGETDPCTPAEGGGAL